MREDDGLTLINTMIGGSAGKVGSLDVIAAPGHTPGHVALLDDRDRMLYCGDVYSTLGGVATSATVYSRCPLALFPGTVRSSLRAPGPLCVLERARLAPGHGKVVESPLGAMDRAIASGS